MKTQEKEGIFSPQVIRIVSLSNVKYLHSTHVDSDQYQDRISMTEDFRKVSSLCRHGKFNDAESLMNHTNWTLPMNYQDEQGNTLLMIAVQNGSRRFAKLFLRQGADINMQNHSGQTVLHFAFAYGFTSLGEYLVSKGADDQLLNKDGLTCYEGLNCKSL